MGLFGSHARVGASAAGSYEIERSLRFNAPDSAYLYRTFGTPTSSDIWTLSLWLKRGDFASGIWAGQNVGSDWVAIQFNGDHFMWRDRPGGASNVLLTTNRDFRDPAAWYHFVLIYDSPQTTSSDRAQLWINGVRETSFSSSTYPSQDADSSWNKASNAYSLGGYNHGSIEQEWSGYMADVHFIDGQNKPPSNFGETDAVTGQWIPKKYDGTYGNNGFKLDFSDNSNTTSTTLGKDRSGNDNDWTPSGFSVSGAATDSFEDTPTNNFCTMNPIAFRSGVAVTPAEGNLYTALSDAGTYQVVTATQAITSGKWYWEVTVTAVGSQCNLGVTSATWDMGDVPVKARRDYQNNGNKNTTTNGTNTATSSWGATYTTGDVIGIAVDMSAGSITFYKNGSSQGAAYTDLASAMTSDGWIPYAFGYNGCNLTWNFGQRAFAHSVPTGHLKLCTADMSAPTIKNGTDYFNSILYTATGVTNRTLTGVGFSPNLGWFARRNASGAGSMLFDTVRGATKELYAPYLNGEDAVAESVKSFDSDGYTLGNNWPNATGTGSDSWVNWNWKESVSAGFDIITYEGNGVAGRTVAHNLGVAPNWIVVKDRDASRSWAVGTDSSWDKNLRWEDANGLRTTDKNSTQWYETAPTSSVFYVGDGDAGDYSGDTNVDGENYIAYVFASVEGYSKAGSYEGIGGTDGPFIYTGFKPAWVLIKNIDSDSRNWIIKTAKIPGYNVVSPSLATNNNYAEESNEGALDFLSNGFKIRNNGSYTNENNSTHIYLAFAEAPFKYANAR